MTKKKRGITIDLIVVIIFMISLGLMFKVTVVDTYKEESATCVVGYFSQKTTTLQSELIHCLKTAEEDKSAYARIFFLVGLFFLMACFYLLCHKSVKTHDLKT